jgi:hypothetical protein
MEAKVEYKRLGTGTHVGWTKITVEVYLSPGDEHRIAHTQEGDEVVKEVEEQLSRPLRKRAVVYPVCQVVENAMFEGLHNVLSEVNNR